MGWSFTGSYMVFGGLVFINFMAVLMLVIYCSKRLHPSDMNPTNASNNQEKPQIHLSTTEDGAEQVVVIMAGDQTPSYIAKPSPSLSPPPPRLSEEV